MGPGLDLTRLSVGMDLPELKKSVTQAHINLYAEASRDFNPIHIDLEFARKTQLGGTVAHGMLILAYISELMVAGFGRDWLTGGKLNVRFKAAARPGDTITAGGRITRIETGDGHTLVYCEVLCRNQRDEPVIIGETKVKLKKP